jgi:hypothetical protein
MGELVNCAKEAKLRTVPYVWQISGRWKKSNVIFYSWAERRGGGGLMIGSERAGYELNHVMGSAARKEEHDPNAH